MMIVLIESQDLTLSFHLSTLLLSSVAGKMNLSFESEVSMQVTPSCGGGVGIFCPNKSRFSRRLVHATSVS
jgi:hypothetical protein